MRNFLSELDVADVVVHAVVAPVLVLAMAWIVSAFGPIWGAAVINSIIWPVREATQRAVKHKMDPTAPPWYSFSGQNIVEAVVPVVTGWIGAAVLAMQ